MHISKKRTSLHNIKALPQLILISGIKVKISLNFRQDSKSSNNVCFFLFTGFFEQIVLIKKNAINRSIVFLWNSARTYLQSHYGNGVLGNVYLSAGQH